MLPAPQQTTLFRFYDVIRQMLSELTDQSSLQQLETELNIVLALMERDFPIDIQVFVVVFFFPGNS